jgi:hypothetical protein
LGPTIIWGQATLGDPGDSGLGLSLAAVWLALWIAFAYLGGCAASTSSRDFLWLYERYFERNHVFALTAFFGVVVAQNVYTMASGDGVAYGLRLTALGVSFAGLGYLFIRPVKADLTE